MADPAPKLEDAGAADPAPTLEAAPAVRVAQRLQQDGWGVTMCQEQNGLDTVGSIYEGATAFVALESKSKLGQIPVAHGKGKLTLSSGSVYDGDWENGLRHGRGRMTDADGDVYEGDWRIDTYYGVGKLTLAGGRGYADGQWKLGVLNGHATEVKPNGSKYVGAFLGDKWHGKGKLYDSTGALVREGEWRHGNEAAPKPAPVKKHHKYELADTIVVVDGRHQILAEENATINQIAKELDCPPEEIVKVNEDNPGPAREATIGKKATKFKNGTVVWLPNAACIAYLANYRAAKAEADAKDQVAKADAEAETAKADAAKAKAEVATTTAEAEAAKAEAAEAKAEAEAAKAEAAALKQAAAEATAATETATAAAGPKHVSRVPGPAVVEERLTQLAAEVQQASADAEQTQAQKDRNAAIPGIDDVIKYHVDKGRTLTAMKRNLKEALEADGLAAEQEHAAKQRRQTTQQELMQMYDASSVPQ